MTIEEILAQYGISTDDIGKCKIRADVIEFYNESGTLLGSLSPSGLLQILTSIQAPSGVFSTSVTSPLGSFGTLTASVKNFRIVHPSNPKKMLQYACLEGPENGVYVRGQTHESHVKFPEYWKDLVDPDSITINITPIGSYQHLYVMGISVYGFSVKRTNEYIAPYYFYQAFATRKDVPSLQVEV